VAVKTSQTFTALSTGSSHNCARTATGSLYCWGANGSGRLGDGTTTDQRIPTVVASTGTAFASVAAGGGFTCALTASGTAMCWGSGASGALGDSTLAGHLTPTAVSGTTSFASIATGTVHACAVTAAGQVYCWGANQSGRLGDGTSTNRLIPTTVTGPLLAGSLDLGFEHSCAVSKLGSAICWGRDAEGQLGDGAFVAVAHPVGVKKP
jgi:alpha-tubulin suppressor-like RCC1 family protein